MIDTTHLQQIPDEELLAELYRRMQLGLDLESWLAAIRRVEEDEDA